MPGPSWSDIIRMSKNPFDRLLGIFLCVYKSATQRVISLTFLGMVIGISVDILIAAKLGTGQTADALIIALSIPFFLDTVMRAGANHSMVPFFIERKSTLTKVEYHYFVSSLINLALTIGFIIVVLIEVLSPWIVSGLAPKLSTQGKIESAFLLRICAPMVIFAFGISILSPLLNSQKLFIPVALRNAMTPAVVVVAIGLTWNWGNTALWIAAAYTVGFAGFFLTLFLHIQRTGNRYYWSAWVSQEDLSHFWAVVSLPTLGFIIRQGARLVERLLASLVSVGGVAAYYFAFRIFSALQTLLGYSLLTIGLPDMTGYGLAGDKARLAAQLRQSLVRCLLLSLPTTTFILVFHVEIIRWAYGRGAFSEVSIQQTSSVLFWLALGLVFFCMIPVLQSGLYAQRAFHLIFRNVVTVTCMHIALAWLFSKWYGLAGIAMAVSLSSVLSAGYLMYLLHKTGVFFAKTKMVNSLPEAF